MTMTDNWLLERAHKRKLRGSAAPDALPPVDNLWRQLQEETKRQAKVYTDACGDPKAVVIETTPDAIDVRVPDGRQLTLRVDRERRTLSQTVRTQAGAVRQPKPNLGFALSAAGEVIFNFGGLHGAAGSLLRRLIG